MVLSPHPPPGPGLSSFLHGFPSVLRGKRRKDIAIRELLLPLYLLLFWTSCAEEGFLISDCFFHHEIH